MTRSKKTRRPGDLLRSTAVRFSYGGIGFLCPLGHAHRIDRWGPFPLKTETPCGHTVIVNAPQSPHDEGEAS